VRTSLGAIVISVSRQFLTISVSVMVVATLPFVAAESAALAGADYDSFNGVTLNEVVSGQEVGQFRLVEVNTPEFDTSGFSVQDEEYNATPNRNGCSKTSGDVFAGKTAWVRFDPGVDGTTSSPQRRPTTPS
jgi:hypothetical protein